MPKKNPKHVQFSEYASVASLAAKYNKTGSQIAGIMQKRAIFSMGKPYDEINQYDHTPLNYSVSDQHSDIKISDWQLFNYDSTEDFLYKINDYSTSWGNQEFKNGYKDILIHAEEFRKKSGLIKTKMRVHEHIKILENIYLDMKGQKNKVKPDDFVTYIKELKSCEFIVDVDEDTITLELSSNKLKDIKVSAIKDRVSKFNKKHNKLRTKT